jgi:hypothetical protein
LQARALRDLPKAKIPRNFTLTAKQAQAIRPARRSWLAALFPALRTATALSTFAFVAVLAVSLLQQPAVLQTASAPEMAMEKGTAAEDSNAAGAAAAPTEDLTTLQRNTLEATPTLEPLAGITSAQSLSETQVAEYALTPEFAPEAANAPPAADAAAQSPAAATGLQLAAIGLGLVTAILAILTWLARR